VTAAKHQSNPAGRPPIPRWLAGLGGLTAAAGGYVLVVRGALVLDLNIGRRTRALGPITLQIAAPPDTVFDVIAAPYLGRTPRAMQTKLQVLDRGSDMVLAAHFTRVAHLTATTVETVRFERPHRVSFRLLRGPVPHVLETYELRPTPQGTELYYSGELGTDLWRLGQWWADRVAPPWNAPSPRRSTPSAPKPSDAPPAPSAELSLPSDISPSHVRQTTPPRRADRAR